MKKKLLSLMAAAVLVLSASPAAVSAETVPEGFVQTDHGVMWSNGDGTFLSGTWLHVDGRSYHLDGDGNIQTGFQTIDGKRYYLPEDGVFVPGWEEVDGRIYYVQQDGSLATDTVINGYVIGSDGAVTGMDGNAENTSAAAEDPSADPAFEQTVQQVLAACTTPDMTKEEKLRAAFQYVLDATTYLRDPAVPSGDGWYKQYAMDIYTTGRGNCYRYAAAIGCLAKEIGYETKLCVGNVSSSRGGLTPHGWCEVKVDGTWYILDGSMADAGGDKYYMVTHENYPRKQLIADAEYEVKF